MVIYWSMVHDDSCATLALEIVKGADVGKVEKAILQKILRQNGCESHDEAALLDAMYRDFTEVLE